MLLTVSGVTMQHNATQTLSCNTVARLKPRYAGWLAGLHKLHKPSNPEKLHEVLKVNHLATYTMLHNASRMALGWQIVLVYYCNTTVFLASLQYNGLV